MHPFSTPVKHQKTLTVFLCFKGVEKGCIGKEWVKVTEELKFFTGQRVFFINKLSKSRHGTKNAKQIWLIFHVVSEEELMQEELE